MLEAILRAWKRPSKEEPDAAKLASARARVINVARFKSNCAAFLLDHYLLKEFVDAGGNKNELYAILLPVYEQAYLDELEVAEEFRKISNGDYFDKVMNYAKGYASEVSRIKLKLKQLATASST